MDKPVLLYCRQRSEGIGRLLQCLALAKSLSRHYHPVVLDNGALPAGVEAPAGVDVVQIPPRDPGRGPNVVDIQQSRTQQQMAAVRREFMLQQYADLEPAVLMIDTFPFGEAGQAGELLPLLEHARNGGGLSPLVLCGLQDIQVRWDPNPRKRDDETAELLQKYFDAVLVHADPAFARVEEFFQPKNALSVPIYYTGFLLPGQHATAAPGAAEERILVSAGSGATGGPLFHAAIDAHRLLWEAERLPMTLVTGPLFSREDWSEMQGHTKGSQALTIKRSVPNLGAEMRKVRWSVSQCGYNTAAESVASRVSALFVPSPGGRHGEQVDRAHRLAHWGVGRLLVQEHLNGVSLANEIMQLIRFVPRETAFNMAGSETTVRLIEQMCNADADGSSMHAARLII